jgi:hypothetical protein
MTAVNCIENPIAGRFAWRADATKLAATLLVNVLELARGPCSQGLNKTLSS